MTEQLREQSTALERMPTSRAAALSRTALNAADVVFENRPPQIGSWSKKHPKLRKFLAASAICAIGFSPTDSVVSTFFWDTPREPAVSQHTDCIPGESKFAYVETPGTGLPTAGHAANIVSAMVKKFGGCTFSVDFGTRLNVPLTQAKIIDAVDKSGLLPAANGSVELVFSSASYSGIFAQQVANDLTTRPQGKMTNAKKYHVAAILLKATPSGTESVREPLAREYTQKCIPLGKGMGIGMNGGSAIRKQRDFRQGYVWYDLVYNAMITSGNLTAAQSCAIAEGYPNAAKGEDSLKFYEYSDDDDVVNGAIAYEKINQKVGYTLILNKLKETGHATDWLDFMFGMYESTRIEQLAYIQKSIDPTKINYCTGRKVRQC